MINLYTWRTPNGRKISIALEEFGLPYTVFPIDISKNEQFAPDFLNISPNNKIPAIVDEEAGNLSVFESGAILIYLAEKTGKFLPASGAARYKVLEWLNWQVGGMGPMFGQFGHFTVYAPEKIPYAVERYTGEVRRLLGVLDKRLSDAAYVGGDDYSIADMAIFPWLAGLTTGYKAEALLDGFNYVQAYIDKIAARPAVGRGMLVPQV
ncbi:glutathione S-transferase C-terminal domain-containing protein [Asticcacaulis endophyticus]|uniref:Glutathione S-transferase n=1 Tax=Asticcacaulis endophyticus TaxID=1395890 RepID=A0A918PXJ7_9CAUL|nr:glutathione S-transferase C-terminal domain-containing protein [Asticcacaulis endophyticus]GGZ26311.1 glutathione S-transferase [Asticcacaulis endophyticus]